MATENDIQMEPVSSSQIAAMGYDKESKTARVDFNSGATYDYDDVPLEVYDAVRNAPSVGQSFNQQIKGVYVYRKIS